MEPRAGEHASNRLRLVTLQVVLIRGSRDPRDYPGYPQEARKGISEVQNRVQGIPRGRV